MPSSPARSDSRLVILLGPGRSGTSSMAGTLAHLGLLVPKPEVAPNKSNPRGFFEPQWVVDFHKEVLDEAGVRTLDLAPDAPARVDELIREGDYADRLRTWLSDALGQSPQIIVKDPRTVLLSRLWVDTARELGVEPGFVTMMRHPAEVSASRQMHYTKSADEDRKRALAVRQIGGWINIALESERVTRGSRRVVVRYPDLLADWRAQAARVRDGLDLAYDPDLSVDPHPVDDFLDVGLRRNVVDWSAMELPESLVALGEGVWQAYAELAEMSGDAAADADLEATFDRLTETYAAQHEEAVAFAADYYRRDRDAALARVRARMPRPGALRSVARRIRPQRSS
ncbi:sulfotransferase family protein [Mumia sp. DW29H23]|uniref:sulfotransferase family protein n=1 Tax=Mumia sp. DW29H23 TaxID=3421241 RepID=UPI003D68E9D0